MIDFLRRIRKPEHEWVEESLSAYIDGELSSQDAARVEKHLRECETCSQNLVTLRQTVALVGELSPAPAPRSFVVRPAAVGVKPRPVAPRRGYGLLRGATALAALLLVLLVGGDLTLQFLGGSRLAVPAPPAPAAEVALAPSPVPSVVASQPSEEPIAGGAKAVEDATLEPVPENAQVEEPLTTAPEEPRGAEPTEISEGYLAPSPQHIASPITRTECVEAADTPTPLSTPGAPPVVEDEGIAREPVQATATLSPAPTPEVVAMAEVPSKEAQERDQAVWQTGIASLSPLRLAELVVFAILLILIAATLLTRWLIGRRT